MCFGICEIVLKCNAVCAREITAIDTSHYADLSPCGLDLKSRDT